MRTALILLGLALVLFSCNREPDAAPEKIWCTLKCQDPQIKVQLPFGGDTTKGMYLVAYKNDGSFHDTVSVTFPSTVTLAVGYDYHLFIPKLNKTFVFNYVNSYQSDRIGKCGTACANAVPGIQMQYGWEPCSYNSALTGELEYTLYPLIPHI